jgi:NADPH:quinone reductase
MRAIVVYAPGGPEVLQLEEVPTPTAREGWVLIRVRAFGLNRSELFTRQGHSPSVRFPRVLGIECVGEVAAAPASDLQPGQTVAALMGEMGRAFDGGYAEYTLVPASQAIPIVTDLPWTTLAAIPETFLTAWGSLFEAMDVQPGQVLLIRGGTSALGMAATTLAKDHGLRVIATTRSAAKTDALRANGADEVIVDEGRIAERVHALVPGGVDAVLELVGTVTLRDSLQAVRPQGIVCQSGILGNKWRLEFEPLEDIPSTVRLTVYRSATITRARYQAPLQQIVDGVAAGRYHLNLDRVFAFEDIVAAHRYMEESRATGKLVVEAP